MGIDCFVFDARKEARRNAILSLDSEVVSQQVESRSVSTSSTLSSILDSLTKMVQCRSSLSTRCSSSGVSFSEEEFCQAQAERETIQTAETADWEDNNFHHELQSLSSMVDSRLSTTARSSFLLECSEKCSPSRAIFSVDERIETSFEVQVGRETMKLENFDCDDDRRPERQSVSTMAPSASLVESCLSTSVASSCLGQSFSINTSA